MSVTVRFGSQVLLDTVVAALALTAALTQLKHGGMSHLHGRLDPAGVLLTAGSTLPLIGWRRSPLSVFVVTAVFAVALAGLGYPVDLLPGPTVALYLLVSTGPPVVRTAPVVATVLTAYLIAAALAQSSFPGMELLHAGLTGGVAWFAGDRTRLRREQLADLRQRAVRAEREADRERQLAVAEERTRIARDLHDSAGHAINVIAVRAGAARLRQDPDRCLVALQAIEDLARQTAEDIDRTVGSLRDNRAPAPVEAPAGLASLGTLIGQHAAAGLAVTLDTAGAPRPLGAALDQAAYRIIQEALTNAARHGAGGTAGVKVGYGNRAVELTITNPARDDQPRNGGHGLVGMRERASLLGGDLDAARIDGMFRVRARLPYGGRSG